MLLTNLNYARKVGMDAAIHGIVQLYIAQYMATPNTRKYDF